MMIPKIIIGALLLLEAAFVVKAFASTEEIVAVDNSNASIEKAVPVTSKIVRIASNGSEERLELFLENGMVATLKNPASESVALANKAKTEGAYLDFVLRESDFVVYSFNRAQESTEASEEANKRRAETADFLALMGSNKAFLQNVISFDQANQIFANMHPRFAGERRFIRRAPSQCFRRAEVWTYEMERNNQVEARKFFLMFTGRYRSGDCSYKWWFHVTPYVFVKDNQGNTGPITLDKEFADGPMGKDAWARIFVSSKGGGCYVPQDVRCPVLKYNQYDVFKREYNNQYCMMFDTSRFYYYPTDMENATLNGVEKNSWNMEDVSAAYEEKI